MSNTPTTAVACLSLALGGPLASQTPRDLVAAARAAGKFETLTAALDAASLTDVLRGEGPFTVLAPTDEAFAALPPGRLALLLRPENRTRLAHILRHHVVAGRLDARSLVRAGEVATSSGATVGVRLRDGRLTVGDARVSDNDIAAANGVLHAIDTVLMPPPTDPVDLSDTAWYVLNDDVMGGVSRSRVAPAGRGTILFTGRLSLENGGGFASARTRPRDLGLGDANAFRLRVRGDGRSYQLGAHTGDRQGRYQTRFATVPGAWQVITIPIADLRYTVRGTVLEGRPPVRPERIRALSLLIADGNDREPFALEVDWIRAVRL